jgi:translocation and assembly module TamB
LRRLLRLLLVIALLSGMLLLSLPLTAPGSRLLFGAIDRLTPLEIKYRSGSLASELQLDLLAVETGSLALKLEQLQVALVPACLWRSELCLRRLQAARFDLALRGEPVEEKPGALAATAMIQLPVAVTVEVLAVDALRVQWRGGEWRQGAMRARVALAGSTVAISGATVKQAHLELHAAEQAEEPSGEEIELPAVALPLELRVEELALQEPSWDAYGTQHRHQSIELRGSWRGTRLHLLQFDARTAQWGRLSLQGELDLSGRWPLQAAIGVAVQQPPVTPLLHDRELTLEAEGDLAALRLSANLSGSPGVTLVAELNALDRQLPFEARARAAWKGPLAVADLVRLPESLRDLELASPLLVTARGTLREQSFSLQGEASALGYRSVALSLRGGQRQGRIAVDELLLREAGGANALHGGGELVLGEELRWTLSLDSPGIDLPALDDYASGRVAGGLRVEGAMAGEHWRVALADVDLEGVVNELPARVSGQAGLRAGGADAALPFVLDPGDLQAEVNGARLSLRSPRTPGTGGYLDLAVEELGRWLPGSRGRLRAGATIAPDWQALHFTGELQGFASEGVAIDGVSLSGNYRLDATGAFDIKAQAAGIGAAAVDLESLQLVARGTRRAQQVTLESSGDLGVRLALRGAVEGNGWRGELAPTTLQMPLGAWRLAEPVALEWSAAASRLAVADHCWRQVEARVCASALSIGAQGGVRVEAAGELGAIAVLLPEGMQAGGELRLDLEAGWGGEGGLRLTGSALGRALRLTRVYAAGESATAELESVALQFGERDGGMQLDLALRSGDRGSADLRMLLPAERQAPLAGSIALDRIQLDSLAPFAPEFRQLEGELSGRLELAGTVDQPRAQGWIRLDGGRLAVVGSPTELQRLALEIDVLGRKAELRGSGELGGGALQLSGRLDGDPEPRLALKVTGGRHQLFYPPSARMLVSEDLSITAAAGELGVSGEVTVHEGRLEHEAIPEGGVTLSPDVVEVDSAGKVIRAERPFDTSIDVWLRMPERFRVVGSNVNVTVGGDLQLLQTAGRPLQLFGNLNVAGGELRAFEQHLKIRRGTIAFAGVPDNPELDVRAERTIPRDDVRVGVAVVGTLDEPELELYSEPQMSQAEQLSYLVRGRGPDTGAGADGTAAALSLGTTLVNRSELVSGLNRLPGISNVGFGAQGSEENTAATVSGYIGERLYLSYGVGLYEPINVLTARFYLKTRLWLEVVSQLENSADLYYSFDIN